jgi:hypothetical protein
MAEPTYDLENQDEQNPYTPGYVWHPHVIPGGGDPTPFQEKDRGGLHLVTKAPKKFSRPQLQKLEGEGLGDGQPAASLAEVSKPVYNEPTGVARSEALPDLRSLEGQNTTPEVEDSEPSEPEPGVDGSNEPTDSIDSPDNNEAENNADEEPDDQLKEAKDTNSDHQDRVGRGYRKTKKKPGFIRQQLGKQNRIFLIGGGSSLIIILAIVALFFFLAPLKILHIVSNLQSRFYASSENALQKETNVLFSDYIKRTLRNCPGKVDRNCNPIQDGTLVSQLFKGWRHAKLEDKIAAKYHIEFEYFPKSGRYYMKAPGLSGAGLDLGTNSSGFMPSGDSLDDHLAKSNQFTGVTRKQLRATINQSINDESRWKQAFYRFKVGRFMESKYGIKRCIFACDTRDDFADWKDQKRRAAKLIIAERVLRPRGETLALVIQCVIDNTCDPNHNTFADADGRKQSKVQRDIQARLAELAITDTGKYAAVIANSNDIMKDGYQKYVAKKVVKAIVEGLGGKEGATEASDKLVSGAVPVVGWVNIAANTVSTLDGAATKAKALSYITNATAMAGLYTTYRTYADEVKSGHVDPGLVGSFNSSLGPGDSSSTGGTAEAEQAPIYKSLFGDGTDTQSGIASSLLGRTAYAASNSSQYKCSDGNPVPAGKQVCPEEVLGGLNSIFETSLNQLRSFVSPLASLAKFWNGSLGKPFQLVAKVTTYLFESILKLIPHYDDLVGLVGNMLEPLVSVFTDKIFLNPFSDNMGGARTVDLIAGGADTSGNDYTHNGLGGKRLTDKQASLILAEQHQQSLMEFKKQSFFARMFNSDSEYSLASKLALAMPSSGSGALHSLASFFGNPFGQLSYAFGHIIPQANAATNTSDPFGVTQYGYPDNDPDLAQANQNPEAYWMANCSSDGMTLDWKDSSKANSKWQDSSTVDPDTGLPENDTTDPCLLIQAAVGSAGAIFDSSTLTQDDLVNQ